MESHFIAGLDIGTTKIGVIIGEVTEEDGLNVIGVGMSPSDGLRKGVVVNIDKTVNAIEHAVEEAELMAGIDVDSVFVGIAGGHIKSINSKGVVAITNANNEISQEDVERVIEQAKAVAIPMDREIIHVIPQEFIVDVQTGIKEPIGMSGVRLEVEAHVVTGAITSAANIYKSVEKAGLNVLDLVLEPLASSYAVLSKDERELGVALVELGAGSTDLAVFQDGKFRHLATFGFAGAHVTSDIAQGLAVTQADAERLKERYGYAFQPLVDPAEMLELPGTPGQGPREAPREFLAHIIHQRLDEVLRNVGREIERAGYLGKLASGVVLTGGTAQLAGIVELAREVLAMPVRLGVPGQSLSGSLTDAVEQPRFSTATGLALYGIKQMAVGAAQAGARQVNLDRVVGSVRRWLTDFF